MKVILIKDVARLGRKSEVKEVPDGHALNFLIPRKLAIIATPESMKRLTEELKEQGAQKAEVLASFVSLCETLAEHTVTYSAVANEQGHLFKGVSADDVSRRLAEEGFRLPVGSILLEHPLKDVGVHEIPLSYGGKKGVCRLEIIKQ